MPKNIVICCDGTSNEFSAAATNVVKLCMTLVQNERKQVVYYHPGLGTMEPPGALTNIAIKWTKLLGLAVGYGLRNDIRDAYVFLMNRHEAGDKLFVFGFSRGAYTARALTSLLHMYGLLRPGNEALVPYAIRMMLGVNNLPEHMGENPASIRKQRSAEDIWRLANAFKRTFSTECSPWFVGLWDTVNSVGLFSQSFHTPYTANNPDIQVARHALAIDEHRGFFRLAAWFPKSPPGPQSGPKDLLQVWFAGDHSDVGGGYPEAEAGQSKCTLKWMVCEAAKHGLLFEIDRLQEMFAVKASAYVAADPTGPLHNSLTGWWRLLEFVPKKTYDPATHTWKWRMNRFRRRLIPEGSNVHDSVVARGGAYRARCRNFPSNPRIVYTECDPALGI